MRVSALLNIIFLLPISGNDPSGQDQAVEQTHPGDAKQAHLSPTPQGRSTRCRSDQGLHLLKPPPLQETRFQKLLQHLPSVLHPPPVQHPLFYRGAGAEAGLRDRGPERGCIQIFPKRSEDGPGTAGNCG